MKSNDKIRNFENRAHLKEHGKRLCRFVAAEIIDMLKLVWKKFKNGLTTVIAYLLLDWLTGNEISGKIMEIIQNLEF